MKDKRASPKAKKVVMIWDTQSESLVGNNVYDVENPPAVGSTAEVRNLLRAVHRQPGSDLSGPVGDSRTRLRRHAD